jgi:hypothetical protein
VKSTRRPVVNETLMSAGRVDFTGPRRVLNAAAGDQRSGWWSTRRPVINAAASDQRGGQ